jgi:hypothetical protein
LTNREDYLAPARSRKLVKQPRELADARIAGSAWLGKPACAQSMIESFEDAREENEEHEYEHEQAP